MQAPRAGTRGFRAPEVLLKYPYQTVAIDIWSAGIIFLCILSMRYPFFNSPDDLSALAEIGALCGSREVREVALLLGRKVHFPYDTPKVNFKSLCLR
jgi:cell division control protein 7